MVALLRISSGLLVSLPAILTGIYAFTTIGDEYYRSTYLMACLTFLIASFVIGTLIPLPTKNVSFRRTSAWLFLASAFAWGIALMSLAVLNLTPLCIGQNNGDGINDIGLCSLYTVLITVSYSPPILALLALNALLGGVVIRFFFSKSRS